MALDNDPELEVAADLRARQTRLSVNLNKIALLRNARGTGVPGVAAFARRALEAGAGGLTAHPRPDGRHIVADDVLELRAIVSGQPGAELNIEGRPTDDFLDLVARARPHQCSLVPDAPGVLTSDRGWDLSREFAAVAEAVARLKALGCRAILFVDPSPEGLELVRDAGADGVEIHTGRYATAYRSGDATAALAAVQATAARAAALGLMVNAGHDLTTENLAPLLATCRFDEVSIGHELVADALWLGFAPTVRTYLAALNPAWEEI
ncbi:MAG TPA: pyridoxine 5'-phosphate synthase [Caulobacteraceae bacterium]|jgi:pyridoxine 5-phosphate synthase|nr:pyridoxine 5'-phosphate synthase [Caulobacteraceae bacterium]